MAKKETSASPSPSSSPTKGFLLRLDPAVMAQVEEWAAQEFRSVNGQLQWIVAEALKRRKRSRRSDD